MHSLSQFLFGKPQSATSSHPPVEDTFNNQAYQTVNGETDGK